MADFYLYADESGKLQSAPYTSFCGFVTHHTEWQRFSQAWENCRSHEVHHASRAGKVSAMGSG